jgi:hypothetical protein
MAEWMTGWVLLLAVAGATALAAGEPYAPKLGDPPPPVDRGGEPARRLPATVAVCHLPSARRCWLAPSEAGCTAAGGRVFRIVIDQPSRADAEQALKQCVAELDTPP